MPRLFPSGAPLPGCLPWVARSDDADSSVADGSSCPQVEKARPEPGRRNNRGLLRRIVRTWSGRARSLDAETDADKEETFRLGFKP
jgi:hypothetical protein